MFKRCKHCKKIRGEHNATTMECPRFQKTRIGHISYGPTKFEADEKHKPKEGFKLYA